MSDTTKDIMGLVESWQYHDFTLTSGQHCYKNTIACVDTGAGTGTLLVGAASATYVFLGVFDEEVDASSAAKTVRVRFLRERHIRWFASTGIAATDLGKICYINDNQTVGLTAGSHAPAGMIVGYSSTKGAAVDADIFAIPTTTAPTITNFTNATHGHTNDAGGGVLAAPAITSFASATHGHTNDAGGGVLAAPAITSFASATHGHTNAAGGGVLAAPAITSFASATHTHANAAGGGAVSRAFGGTLAFTGGTATITAPGNWTFYACPVSSTTSSAIVLGSSGSVKGDEVVFLNPGTATGTMTYYDGTIARTAALSASKSHRAIATFDGTVWCFDYTVGAA